MEKFVRIITMLMLLTGVGCGRTIDGNNAAEDSLRSAMKDSLVHIREISDLTAEAGAYADSVLQTLTIEQRIGMLYMPAVYGRSDASNLRLIMNYVNEDNVGGILLLKGDLRSAALIADTLRTLPGPGLFVAVDAENGLRMRFADAPEFPWNRELGKVTDDQLLYEAGYELARECREIGVNMVLGPVMDVVPGEGSHGLMRKRSLGSDPKRVADLALAYARGVEDGNVISVAKHFPGHGSASADSHKALGEIRSTREMIDSVDLYPFRRYAQEGFTGVMVGHLSVKALDSLKRPAVVSPVVIQDVLRRELDFDGLVLTDALNMEGAMGVKGWEAIAAGADIVIAPTDTRREIRATLAAIEAGNLTKRQIDDRCRRILFYKYLTGMENAPRIGDIDEAIGRVGIGAGSLRDSITSNLRLYGSR